MKMKGMVQKMLILVVSSIIIMMWIAGCQESATGGPTDAKKGRLVAAENIKLKNELGQRDKEIERLKQLHSKEIKRQEELLVKCQEEKELWKAKADENIKEQVSEVSGTVMEQNSKLQEENADLKSQVEKLKAELAGKQQGEKPKE
jgi:hypothetical protein